MDRRKLFQILLAAPLALGARGEQLNNKIDFSDLTDDDWWNLGQEYTKGIPYENCWSNAIIISPDGKIVSPLGCDTILQALDKLDA